jgi:hypothetical protein
VVALAVVISKGCLDRPIALARAEEFIEVVTRTWNQRGLSGTQSHRNRNVRSLRYSLKSTGLPETPCIDAR